MRTHWRRMRGWLLRVAFDRRAAVAAGVVLLTCAAVLVAADFPWESWATDGLVLVAGATGAALVLMALGGRRPDWIDPEG